MNLRTAKIFPVGPKVVLLLAALLAGCETDGGISARIQEKSAVYATLQPWEKKYIAKGEVAPGFTPDMIYMAMGRPTKVEQGDDEGKPAELWTYSHYYLTEEAAHSLNHTYLKAKMHTLTIPAPVAYVPTGKGDMTNSGPMSKSSPFPMGAQSAPVLYSYTVQLIFKSGAVYRASATREYD